MIQVAYGLTKDIKAFYFRVRKSYNSPINKSYAGYTVLSGIAIPFVPLLVSSSLIYKDRVLTGPHGPFNKDRVLTGPHGPFNYPDF
jgi:hypothetical protein